ncbi:MAG TPA: HAMP domain-containing sensor histidine kinase [Cyclobacteriaceae bacterium]|jgi:signal transduction histidine kinase|nr:HAMP domain-containing sensor histidine kinase [Cyclobacteriaceae bacterium]
MKQAIRNLIIGKDVYIESRNEYRQIMLSGQYALLSLAVIGFYIFMETPLGFNPSKIILCLSFALVVYSLILHRKQRHCLANYILFPTLNLLVYLFASSESRDTWAIVFFIPISLGSFAVFNYSQRKVATTFALLSFALFVFSIVQDFSILPYRNYSPQFLQVNQLINFVVAFHVSVMTVYLLISLNHHTADQLVQANKQLKKLNDELDRFVYSTSHDLRAPLLSVLGLLKLAEGDISKKELDNYHGMMQTRLTSLDKFIKDITDYSRNNRLQIVNESVNLFALTNEIWESLRYSADAQGIEFANELPEDFTMINDGTRLRVVLSNLIANAIRYHDHRKEKKYIKVYHNITSTSFSLHVEDNGQGISPELHSKIFEMFYRGNESSQGSGLGLYIVKETLAKLSGSIQLCSTPRQGSTFSISVPK